MLIDSTAIAQELRRRRLGRPALVASLDRANRLTWLPGELERVPPDLLVLAAISLASPER